MPRDQQQLHLRDNITHYQGKIFILFYFIWHGLTDGTCSSSWIYTWFLTIYYCIDRPCVVYSDNRPQSTASVTEDLSRCLIRDNNLKSQDSASVGASRIPQGWHLSLPVDFNLQLNLYPPLYLSYIVWLKIDFARYLSSRCCCKTW